MGSKYGRYAVTSGTFLMTVAVASMPTLTRTGMPGWHLAPSLAVAGLAFGIVSGTLADIVLGQVPAASAGSASGTVNTVIQLASVTAITVVGAIFFSALGQSDEGGADLQVAPPFRAG